MMGGETIEVEPVVEPKLTLADNNKIKKMLNWKPTMNLEDWLPKWKREIGL